MTTWFLRSTLALFLFQYMMSVYAEYNRNTLAVRILAEDIVWHMTKALTPMSRDRVEEFFKQIDKHYCKSKQIFYINWRFDFTASRVQSMNCEIALNLSAA